MKGFPCKKVISNTYTTMESEQYNITWNTFSEHLRNMFNDIMKSNKHHDVTLVCDDLKEIKAHKIVLSASSPVLKEIIDHASASNNGQSVVVYLKGIQKQEMESIIKFMYLGEARFSQSRINDFLEASKSLQVKEISENVEIRETEEEEIGEPLGNVQEDDSYNRSNLSSGNDQIQKNTEQTQPVRTNDGKYYCEKCEYQTQNRTHLITHIQGVHDGVKYDCKYCDKQFSDKSNLKKHSQSQHEGVTFECSHCDHQATKQLSLKHHIQTVHEGFRHNCKQCNQEFISDTGLRHHIKSIHKDIRYKCQHCEQLLTSSSSLKVHIESVHQGIKYGCQQCGKQFTSQQKLRKHIQKFHIELK